ncbi:hypothetical protein BIW11_04141 [Tropilaelaps mercedesae]|uniref:Uncharacterized protein n=1 Tax=Tropilaelaps mercedesae TaxID=418985 RepID=A0A1V9XB15_9ACAR|nr:hypothetical protein BIW11_04141 [Tropilaelaps mercedesae]
MRSCHLDTIPVYNTEEAFPGIEETLKKAWNLEGSPFKGTPYDPSVVNMDFATKDLTFKQS